MQFSGVINCLVAYYSMLAILTCESRSTKSNEKDDSNVEKSPTTNQVSRISTGYKYIPMRHGDGDIESYDFEDDPTDSVPSIPTLSNYMPPDLVMSLLRTAYDVVVNVNKRRAAVKLKKAERKEALHAIENTNHNAKYNKHEASMMALEDSTKSTIKNKLDGTKVNTESNKYLGIEESGEDVEQSEEVEGDTEENADVEEGRGMYHDEYEYHDEHTTTTTTTPRPKEMKPRYSDPWTGYYDFLINEGSFKFWSIFQLATVALLLYSAFAAIYYAKFNPVTADYDTEYDDYFFQRSARSVRSANPSTRSSRPSGSDTIRSRTFQRIMDAISKEYL